ncbi:MAG: CHAT domain-containing protein [Lysobacterales bacterium]|jgi:CHAT domain-containing protein
MLHLVGGVLLTCLTCLTACTPREPEAVLLLSRHALAITSQEPIHLSLPAAPGPKLVEILGSDANLDTRLFSTDGLELSRTHLDYLRSAPLYLYLDAAGSANGAGLEITAVQASADARVTVNFYRLPGTRLAEAWRDFARGQRRIGNLEPEKWSQNLAALQSARSRFERLGKQIPTLWAAYLSAYLQYFPLYRYDDAAAGARQVLAIIDAMKRSASREAELSTIEVLAHQLAGQILLERGPAADDGAGESPLAAARTHFTAARDLAAVDGLRFEETWATNNLGISYFYDDELERALALYTKALREAEAAQDSYLVALIGSNVAVALERAGHINEAVRTLEHIERESAVRDSPMEHENVLSLLGNYYLKLYRFPEALDSLHEALDLSEDLESAESRGRNRVMLGRAYREMGQPEKVQLFAELAVPDLVAVDDSRGLRQTHRLLADLHRLQGDFDGMERERKLEQKLLETEPDRADWLFSRAEDEAAQHVLTEAASHFRQSAALFAHTGFSSQSDLALLNACAAQIGSRPTDDCSIERLQPAYDRVEAIQASARALQGHWAWVRLLASDGKPDQALRLARRLVDEIQYYRNTLPGVLGAWYWDSRQVLFAGYLEMLIGASRDRPDGRPDVLLALDELRNADSQGAPRARSAASRALNAAPLRALLARRDKASTVVERVEAQRLIDRELAERAEPYTRATGTDGADIAQQLDQLPPEWSLLAFYLGGPMALAWVGDRDGLRLVELGPSAPILERVDRVRSNIHVYNDPTLESDLAALGEMLLGPVRTQLHFKVMVAAGGALNALPLDALPLDGQPLLETHQVLQIQSVQGLAEAVRRATSPLAPRRLFLAGNPVSPDPALPGSERELEMLRVSFAGSDPGVFMQQDLTLDAFRGDAFRSADLIHLASHALIDRDYPELSRLVLSGADGTEPAYLTPADIEGTALAARLIVLSACETVGVNRFDFDNRLGFVTGLLRQSDALVVASLWPVADRATGDLMAAFYRELAATGDVPAALRSAKLRYRQKSPQEDWNWAAFQLYSH